MFFFFYHLRLLTFPYLLNLSYTVVNSQENDYFLIRQLIDENRYLSFFIIFF